MKTLVIHPKDQTTDFLKEIYKGEDVTLMTDTSIDPSNAIREHDRVIMLGHGSPGGLFRTDSKPTWRSHKGYYIINSSHVSLLKEKTDNVFVWCNADKFVDAYDLKGFYTGMIISEYVEACIFNLAHVTVGEINYSNELLATSIYKAIWSKKDIITEVKNNYVDVNNNDVIDFNKYNLYYK